MTPLLSNTLQPAISLIAQLVLEYSTLTKRHSLASHIIVRTLAIFAVAFGYVALYQIGSTNLLAYYAVSAVHLCACLYLFRESPAQKVFLFFMDWGFTTFILSLCTWLGSWLVPDDEMLIVRNILYTCFLVIIVAVYVKFLRYRIREILAIFNKGQKIYAIFPFLAFSLFTMIFGPLKKLDTTEGFFPMMLFELFVVFCYYLMFSHFYVIFDRLRTEDDLKSAERQLDLQKKYYEEVDNGIQAQRRLIHDSRHHIIAMASLARSGDYPALARYFDELLENYDRPTVRRYCEDSVANAVIAGYVDIAELKGIAVKTELDLPPGIGIDEYELCALFGNTIENAIEACDRIPETSALYAARSIGIKSMVDKGRLVIRIANSYQEDPSIVKGGAKSSKGASGGIGLESVRTIVDQHRGSLSCDRQKGLFVLSAVLCLDDLANRNNLPA
jgi:two-component system, LytTR family, sensor histidine kinase AgrC